MKVSCGGLGLRPNVALGAPTGAWAAPVGALSSEFDAKYDPLTAPAGLLLKNHNILTRRGPLTGNCKRGERAPRRAEKAISHGVRVHIISRDLSCWINADGKGALEQVGLCTRTRRIDRSDVAVGSA